MARTQKQIASPTLVRFLILAACSPCLADGFRMVGPEIQFGPNNAWWSNASYNPAADQYLVVWASVGATWQLQARCINATTGQFAGPEFNVGSTVGLGWPVYCPDLSGGAGWFVIYHTDHDIGGDIRAQKVSAAGNVGGPIILAQNPSDQQTPAADYDPVRKRFLVAWQDYQSVGTTIRGRFFDQNGAVIAGHGELQISDPVSPKSQATPTVAYNPAASEFLVAWMDARNDAFRTNPNENDNNYIDIYGQRVNAITGQLIGTDIPILTPYVQGQPYVGDGQDVPCALACNTNPASAQFGTFLLPDQELTDGFGFTTRGLILDAQGNHYNGMGQFNISHPLRGGYAGGVYSAVDDAYLSTYLDNDYDVSVKAFSPTGQFLSAGKAVAHQDYEENFGSLAIRPGDGQCLQVTTLFEQFGTGNRPHTLIAQRFIRDHAAPSSPGSFVAQGGSRLVRLTWNNPSTPDFNGVMIRYSTVGYPATPASGNLLIDKENTPGSQDTHVHVGVSAGITYYYAAFAHDELANYSPATQASAVPSVLGDFDADSDVDQGDFAHLQACFSGDAIAYAERCFDTDCDLDGDVDSVDFSLFVQCLAGADVLPGCP